MKYRTIKQLDNTIDRLINRHITVRVMSTNSAIKYKCSYREMSIYERIMSNWFIGIQEIAFENALEANWSDNVLVVDDETARENELILNDIALYNKMFV